jgi:arylsulfatase A-like enzyme
MATNGTTSDVLGQRGTLPDLLHEAGYQTYAIGKMHFGPERARHGFDEIVLRLTTTARWRGAGWMWRPCATAWARTSSSRACRPYRRR